MNDPGPLARFQDVVAQPNAMDVIVQKLVDGEQPMTLKAIAKAWGVPYTRLAAWIFDDRERAERYNAALRFAAETYVHEAVPIADEATAERDAVAKAKLQIDTRLRIATKWDRARYGDATEVKHSGTVSLVAILSSMPRGREVDVTPDGATGAALPAPPAANPDPGPI